MIRALATWSLTLSVFLSGSVCAAAESSSWRMVFQQGNAHYQTGDFPAAERSYLLLLEQGIDSAAVYYNLGNACFKQKKLGDAIYYWEKARRKQPGDSDVRENLQLANLMTVDRIDVPEDPLPVRILSKGLHLLTISQESQVVVALFTATNILFGLYRLVRKPRAAFLTLTGSIAAIGLMLLFAGSMGWKIYRADHYREGVIVEQKADIRSGPSQDNITVVTVHEGIVVQVRGESNGWVQISLPNGWTGWLPGKAVRVL